MVSVGKKSPIKPGKYTVLSAYSNEETFNIRIGGFVKEYKHGQEIVLADGDEICPTSTTIILSPYFSFKSRNMSTPLLSYTLTLTLL